MDLLENCELRVFQLCFVGGSKQQQRGRCFCFYYWVETKSMAGRSSFTTSATATTIATISGTNTSSTATSTTTAATDATDATTTVSTAATI